jgi:hypothetical protein
MSATIEKKMLKLCHMRYLNCLLNRRYMQWSTKPSLENGIIFLIFKIQNSEEKKLANIS